MSVALGTRCQLMPETTPDTAKQDPLTNVNGMMREKNASRPKRLIVECEFTQNTSADVNPSYSKRGSR